MRKVLLALALCLAASRVGATSYYMSASGSDSNSGTSSGSPWASPNHTVNCGDTVSAAVGTYSAANFAAGKWGAVTCAGGNNVAWVICATFDACKISSSSSAGVSIASSYWGIQGFEVTTTGTSNACFQAVPPNSATSVHHVIFANDIANVCSGGGFVTFNSSGAGVDYLVFAGDAVYDAATGSANCYSGISVYQPKQSDTVAGTHIYVSGIYSWSNLEPNPCAGGAPTDGEGIILDTLDGSQGSGNDYAQQVVVTDSMVLGNGGRGIQVFNNSAGSAHATIYVQYVTSYDNELDTHQTFSPCGEFQVTTAKVTSVQHNLGMTTGSSGCHSTTAYVAYVYGGDGTDTVANNWLYSAAGNNTITFSSPGFSFGSNTTGTNPSFSSASIPAAPSCGSASSVPNCMATVISNFTPTAGGSTAYGYQPISTGVSGDATFPAWLCNVSLPSGLITQNCGTGTTGTTIVELQRDHPQGNL